MVVQCESCGKNFESKMGRSRFCADCVKKRHAAINKNYRDRKANGGELNLSRKCVVCGREFIRTGAAQVMCKDCAKAKKAASMREYNDRRRGPGVQIRSYGAKREGVEKQQHFCDMCGAPIEKKAANHYFCAECTATRKLEQSNRSNERRRLLRDEEEEQKKAIHAAHASRMERSLSLTTKAYKIVKDPLGEDGGFKKGSIILQSEVEIMRKDQSFTPGTILERLGKMYEIFLNQHGTMKIREVNR